MLLGRDLHWEFERRRLLAGVSLALRPGPVPWPWAGSLALGLGPGPHGSHMGTPWAPLGPGGRR